MTAVDRTRLQEIFTDPDELEDVIAEGIGDICESLLEIEKAQKTEALSTVADFAHRMKGVAGNLGAARIEAAAAALEKAARAGVAASELPVGALTAAVDALCDG